MRRAFFPDTAGVSLYMHNWYRCGRDPVKAALADWVDSTTYARYKRIEAKLQLRYDENEHVLNHAPGKFVPMWCDYCQKRKVISQ